MKTVDALELWRPFELEMRFENELCGGCPRSDDLIRPWLEARRASEAKRKRDLANGAPEKTMDELEAEARAAIMTIEDEEDRAWNGFMRDETGLYVRGGNIRAHLKEGADTLAVTVKRVEEKANFRSKFVDRIYVKEDRIRVLDKNGNPVMEPTGWREHPVHAMTQRGPINSLKRVDYVTDAMLRATILMVNDGTINRDHIVAVLTLGAVRGFNQDRSLGYGRYSWTLSE